MKGRERGQGPLYARVRGARCAFIISRMVRIVVFCPGFLLARLARSGDEWWCYGERYGEQPGSVGADEGGREEGARDGESSRCLSARN